MRKITDIYEEYKIMPNLQAHQLRVASVAMQICDSLNTKVDKNTIVTVCLVHDMGNIIKSNLSYFPEFLEPEGLAYWQGVKEDYIKKYGNNENVASASIAKELGLPPEIILLIENIRFSLICEHAQLDDWGLKIIHYADMRVGPFGVLSFEERLEDGRKRYKNTSHAYVKENSFKLATCGKDVENQIFSHSNIKPEDITDESIEKYLEQLRDFEI